MSAPAEVSEQHGRPIRIAAVGDLHCRKTSAGTIGPILAHVNDVADVLRANGAARAAATVKLHHDLRALDAQRAYVDKIMMKAVTATSATAKLPVLPG